MNLALLCLASVCSIAAGFALQAAPAVSARRGCSAVTAVTASLPWALFVAYYLHIDALEGARYYEWRSWSWTDALAGLVGVPVGALCAGPEVVRRGAAALVITSALLVVAFAKPVLIRMPGAWIKDTWRDDVCLQSTAATCGPCAAATVLRSVGDHGVTERALADEAWSTTSGTLNWLLVRALRDRGYQARFTDPATLDDVTPPAIIGVRLGDVGHFLAYLGRADGGAGAYVIGEPLKGRRVMSADEFARAYAFDRFAIEIMTQTAR